MLHVGKLPGNMQDALDYSGLGARIHELVAPWFGQGMYDSSYDPDDYERGDGSTADVCEAFNEALEPLSRNDRLELLADRLDARLRTGHANRASGRAGLGVPATGGPAQPGEAGEGANSNNMAPPFSHLFETGRFSEYLDRLRALPQGGGGLDWFEATGYGEWDGRNKEKFKLVQQAAQARGEQWAAVELDHGNSKSIALLHERGVGKGFSYQPFVVNVGGIVVGFGAVPFSGEENHRAACWVRVSGAIFLQVGEGGVLRRVAKIMRWLGLSCEFKTGRLDLAVDLPGVSVKQFHDTWDEGRGSVQKARSVKVMYENGDITGLIVHSNVVRLVIYDKRLEVVSQSPDKLPDMMTKRWGGLPDQCVRVEFQVRLSKLPRERKPQTLEDCIGHAWRLFSWLSLKWFRLCDGVADRSHTTRATVAPCWALMYRAAELVFARLDQPLPELAPAEVSKEALLAQFMGLAATMMSHTGHIDADQFFADVMWEQMESSRFREKLANRFAERGLSLREMEMDASDTGFNPDELE